MRLMDLAQGWLFGTGHIGVAIVFILIGFIGIILLINSFRHYIGSLLGIVTRKRTIAVSHGFRGIISAILGWLFIFIGIIGLSMLINIIST